MLLLDCSNPIVVHSMALKNGALIHQIINAFVYHGTRVFETFYVCHILRIPGFLGHCWDSQWCSGGGATGAIAPVPLFQGGAPLQFLLHLFLVNFAYIVQKLIFDLNYYWQTIPIVICSIHLSIFLGYEFTPSAK